MLSAQDCDVLLLAAGFGKRLLPLTATKPKPLLEVRGKPLIAWNLELLARGGFSRVFINLHYLGSQIRDFVGDGASWGLEVRYSEEPVILDTGGGIKNIEDELEKNFLLTLNSDTLVGKEFSFRDLLAEQSKGARASLVVRRDPEAKSFGSLAIDEHGIVKRFLDAEAPDLRTNSDSIHSPSNEVMYAGIQILEKSLLREMPPKGSVFSITKDVYRTLVRNGGILRTCQYEGYWSDVGTPERLESASKTFTG